MRTETKTNVLLLIALVTPLLLIALTVWLTPPPPKEPAQTRIDQGIAQRFSSGQNNYIELTGEGIPSDLHASLSRDADNRSAIIGWLELPDAANRLVVDGKFGYLATGHRGLHVLDISDPGNLHVIGSVPSEGLAWDLIVRDKTVFLSANGLQVIDVSQPSAPRTLATLELPGIELLNLAISGDTLYAGSPRGLQIFDISRPAAPQHVASIPFTGGPWALAIKDNLLLLSLRDQGYDILGIFDISTPRAPQQLATVPLREKAWSISLHDHYVYLPLGHTGLEIIDISEPGKPKKLTHSNNSVFSNFITFDGDRAYCISRNGAFDIYSLESPTAFQRIGAVALPPQTRPVVLRNNVAFVANGQFGLLSIDINSPRPFSYSQTLSEPGILSSMLKHDGLLYLASKESGLYVVQRDTALSGLKVIYHMAIKHGLRAMTRVGNLLCALVNGENRALLIDISDPHSPRIVSTITGSTPFFDTTANDHYFFLAEESGRILMIDASAPESPATYQVANVHTPLRLLANDKRLYVLSNSGNLMTTIAIDSPNHTSVLGQLTLPWPLNETIVINDCTLAENWLAVAIGEPGLLVFDLGNEVPQLISGIDLGEQVSAITYYNDRFYASTRTGELWVLRRKGNKLEPIAATGAMGRALDILIDGDDALLANGSRGLVSIPLPEALDIDVEKAGKRLRLSLPTSLPPGDYRLELLYNKHLFPYAPIRIEPAPQAKSAQKS